MLFRSTISGRYVEGEFQNPVFHERNEFSQWDLSSVFIDREVAVIIPKVNRVSDLPIYTSIWILCFNL